MNVIRNIKIKRMIKGVLSFSLLKIRLYRFFFLLVVNKYFSPEKLLKYYDRICQSTTFDQFFNLVSKIYNRYPNDLVIAEKMVGLMRVENRNEEALNLAKTLCLRRKTEIGNTLMADYESNVSGPRLGPLVQISGYFYSGSGAVLDYLKGFEGSLKWAPGGEVRIVKFPGGLAEIHEKLTKNKSLTDEEIIDFYLHITGCFYVKTKGNEYNKYAKVNKDSKKVLSSSKAVTYVYELLSLWESIYGFSKKTVQREEEFLSIVKNGLERSFNSIMFFNKSKLLLVDQMVTAWRLPAAVLLPPCKFIVVHRDPRDQYIDANSAMGVPGRPRWTAEEFIELYRKRRRLVDDWIPRLKEISQHSFLQISFEDFVLNNKAVSRKINHFLEIDGMRFSDANTKFDPTKSRVNVEKYKKYLKKENQMLFEESLPDFCFHENAN